jgi:hypothetical protein
MTTLIEQLAALEKPSREEVDKWIALFPANDTIKASAIAGFHQAEVVYERARLALAVDLLEESDKAMRNFFSNQFDGGARFSELTGDIPAALPRLKEGLK